MTPILAPSTSATSRLSTFGRLDATGRPARPLSLSLPGTIRIPDGVAAPAPSARTAMPRFEAAFRAVEETLRRLEVERPHELRSPALVEEALDGHPALEGTLVVLDARELRAAELDIEETVADERSGGAFFVSVPLLRELTSRRVRFRDLGSAAAGFAFIDEATTPTGFGRVRFAAKPAGYRRWRMFVADTPGYRVALVSRPLAGGGFVGLWTGQPETVAEVATLLRDAARRAGHEVPAPAPEVPASVDALTERDVWRQAAELRGQRQDRENELREIARAAALRGVELRRQRAAAAAAASHQNAPAA